MKEMNRTLEKVRALRPIDDIMFQKLAESEKYARKYYGSFLKMTGLL